MIFVVTPKIDYLLLLLLSTNLDSQLLQLLDGDSCVTLVEFLLLFHLLKRQVSRDLPDRNNLE